jgi:hypothetical protein
MSLFVVAAACGGSPSAAPPAPSAPTDAPETAAPAPVAQARTPPPARVVAVGDLHADLPAALATLRMAGVVDAAGHWSGGQTVLVQTGDTTDRGPDSKEVIELLMRLTSEAEAAGGRVVALLGNHEVMNLHGDWRYVSPGDVQDFGSADARRAALAPGAPLGGWLRQRDVVAKVGDTVYAHGGITAAWADRGLDAINAAAAEAIASAPRAAVLGEEGPLWFRGYLLADESLACAELRRALAALGARRMVLGHTTQRSGRIASRCGGALLGIDTGISAHYGGNHAALELRAGDAWALYPTGPEDLPDPAGRGGAAPPP